IKINIMSSIVYLRILGYVATIAMHVGNMAYLNFNIKKELIDDPELKTFGKLQPRYFTCWTFFLQILHAIVGLICDYLIISNAKNKVYKLPKYLKGFKNTLFSAVLWPSTWSQDVIYTGFLQVVFTVFWSLFLYDRQLIFPTFVDKVLTTTSNHIMHTAIVGVVLWEVIFLPRTEPRSHKRNLFHLTFHLLLYFAVLVYTYIEHGVWIYPIFSKLYGTIFFPILPIIIGVVAIGFYYLQWSLTRLFWGNKSKAKKIR
ncbi:unnamed protein product, partial [Brenthis ino]